VVGTDPLTRTQRLEHHPHIHCVVPAGGLFSGREEMGLTAQTEITFQFQHAVPQSPAFLRPPQPPVLAPQSTFTTCGHFTGPPYSARIHTSPKNVLSGQGAGLTQLATGSRQLFLFQRSVLELIAGCRGTDPFSTLSE